MLSSLQPPEPTEADLERKRELARKLEEDEVEILELEESLILSNQLTQRMVGMLTSFDERLVKLEGSILPIHRSTQKLTRLYENIDKTLEQVDRVVKYFDLALQEEKAILEGPKSQDLTTYYEVVIRLRDAHEFLMSARYKSCERPLNDLKRLLQKGLELLEQYFQKNLFSLSEPIDPTDKLYISLDYPSLPAESLQHLITLTAFLSDYEIAFGDANTLYRSYVQVRSSYILRCLERLQNQASTDKKLGVGGYVRGTTGLIPYLGTMLRMFRTEYGFIATLFVGKCQPEVFVKTIAPVIDQYLETVEMSIVRVKRSIAKKEYGDVFVLLDVMDNLKTQLHDNHEIISISGAKGKDVAELLVHCKTTLSIFFKEFFEDLTKPDSSRPSELSKDGTVHEIASNTLNYMKRLLEYYDTVESMFSSVGEVWTVDGYPSHLPLPGGSSHAGFLSSFSRSRELVTSSIIAKYFADILDALGLTLETKAKGYKKDSTLGTIFIVNNFHFILKSIRNHPRLAELLGKDIDARYEKVLRKRNEEYHDSWKPILSNLLDSTYVTTSGFSKQLTKSQRQEIKEKFKNFNSLFEETWKSQRSWSVPDKDLREQIVLEVRKNIGALYGRFWDKYHEIEFTKKPQKYMKFDIAALETMVGELFEAKV